MKIARFNTSFLYEGIKLEIFISGCTHNCDGCFNPDLQNFEVGDELYYEQIINKIQNKIKFIDGVVLTGGDPMCNPFHTNNLINRIRTNFPNLKIWLYTGYTKEEIDNKSILKEIFMKCNVVITDRYMKNYPKTELTGSNNQRIWRKGYNT